jgi:hypothetical protein
MVYRDEQPEWTNYLLASSQKYFDEWEKNNIDKNYMCQTRPMQHESSLSFLTNYILETSKNILEGQGYNMNRYELFLSGLWGQNIRKGQSTDAHTHKNSQICGWIFLEAPAGGSYPIFYDTRLNKDMIELDYTQKQDITVATSSIDFNNVVPGTIIFANSWMRHQLSISHVEQPTKVIHFIVSHKEI